ncbi:MAG TPA: TIGR02530 family flagellar biosynthesis protein [Patescibacteria group bacterium]|nr:TIGR02530 family flagellar biosynthesis protein [Patescibacteria group bacterium]
MADELNTLPNNYTSQRVPLTTVPISTALGGSVKSATAAKESFASTLQQELTGVKFSQHALSRLQSRNLELTSDQMSQLSDAVSLASQKGSQKALVIMDDLALVVSVKSRTVITAMGAHSMKDNIVTNIDSAVIL